MCRPRRPSRRDFPLSPSAWAPWWQPRSLTATTERTLPAVPRQCKTKPLVLAEEPPRGLQQKRKERRDAFNSLASCSCLQSPCVRAMIRGRRRRCWHRHLTLALIPVLTEGGGLQTPPAAVGTEPSCSLCLPPSHWLEKERGGNPFRLLAKLLFVWQRLFSSLSISLSLFSQSCKCSLLPFLLTAFELLLLVAWCRSFPSAAPHLTLRQGCYLYHKHPTSWKWAPLQAGDSQ